MSSFPAVASLIAQDVRYGFRMLRKNPGFALVSVLTLAIGIGANTALYSVVDRVYLRPLAYPDSNRLMILWAKPPGGGIAPVAPANYVDFRDQSHVFEGLSAMNMSEFNVTIGGVVERVAGYRVTSEFFDTVGVRPFLGRSFASGEDRPGGPKLAVISYGAWQARFGGDRQVVGQPLVVDGERHTIIGVMPASFRFAMAPELWVPLSIDSGAARDFPILLPLGKLKPGVKVAQAQAELGGIAERLARAYPKALKGWGIDVLPLKDYLGSYARRDVLVLFGAVGFVLLIVCVNVTNLLLAKAAVRERELALRSSLGAGRVRLICQLLTEGLLVAVLGGAAGVVLAAWLCGIAAALVPPFLLDAVPEVGIDWRVLLFSLGVSVMTGLLIGMAPAWRASRVNLNDIIKQAGRSIAGSQRARLGPALVVAEIALSMVLLTGAGLMARSLAGLFSVDPGFQRDHVLTARILRPTPKYTQAERIHAFDRALLQSLVAVRGVRNAAIGSHVPMQGAALTVPFEIVSHSLGRQRGTVQYMSDGYFDALGIRLRSGRLFGPGDNEASPRVVLVNEAFVRRYLGREDAVGQRIGMDEQWVRGRGRPQAAWEIVGVVADVKIGSFGSQAMPQIYAPALQTPLAADMVIVRTDAEPGTMATALRAAIHGVDPEVAVTNVRTMREIARGSVVQPVQTTITIGAFALVALILAALGVYGVMSYTLSQEAHSMGIRLALGARPGDLLRGSLRRGALVALVGLAIGVAGSLALTRVIAAQLYGVRATDPVTYGVVGSILFGVALIACYIPARRASRVDPVSVLRWE